MKKILSLFAIVGLIVFSSCEGPEGPPGQDGDAIVSEVFQVTNVNFTAANDYNPIIPLAPAILQSDMVLLYRKDGTAAGQPVWKLTPELYYFADGTLNFGYNFNFTINDVSVYLDGNDLASVATEFRTNQTFRIVIIPGFVTGKSAKADYSDYNAVIKKYNIDDSNIKNIKL